MSLTVYGNTSCAACKTLLNMAKAQGVEVDYKLIDSSPEVLAEFRQAAQSLSDRPNLPVTVLQRNGVVTTTQGLQAGMSILKLAKEAK